LPGCGLGSSGPNWPQRPCRELDLAELGAALGKVERRLADRNAPAQAACRAGVFEVVLVVLELRVARVPEVVLAALVAKLVAYVGDVVAVVVTGVAALGGGLVAELFRLELVRGRVVGLRARLAVLNPLGVGLAATADVRVVGDPGLGGAAAGEHNHQPAGREGSDNSGVLLSVEQAVVVCVGVGGVLTRGVLGGVREAVAVRVLAADARAVGVGVAGARIGFCQQLVAVVDAIAVVIGVRAGACRGEVVAALLAVGEAVAVARRRQRGRGGGDEQQDRPAGQAELLHLTSRAR